jgi:hypothetical protein
LIRRLFLLISITAALGAGTGIGEASATRLCPENKAPCPFPYASGTVLKAKTAFGSTPGFTTSFGTVVCGASALEIKTTSIGGGSGTAVSAQISALSLTSCVLGSTTCTATSQFLPWSAEVTGGVGGSGTLWVNWPRFKVECGAFMNCTFESLTPRSASFFGGAPAMLAIKAWNLTRIGGLCPAEASFDAEYEVTSPSPLYVTTS